MPEDRTPAEEQADEEIARLHDERRRQRRIELEGEIVEDQLAARRAAADAEASERDLEARLHDLEDKAAATRRAEDDEYRREHWGHGRPEGGGDAA
ncbi:MAG: hypothetical protein U0R70_04460 [Solirubrobacteraceae bacterium]